MGLVAQFFTLAVPRAALHFPRLNEVFFLRTLMVAPAGLGCCTESIWLSVLCLHMAARPSRNALFHGLMGYSKSIWETRWILDDPKLQDLYLDCLSPASHALWSASSSCLWTSLPCLDPQEPSTGGIPAKGTPCDNKNSRIEHLVEFSLCTKQFMRHVHLQMAMLLRPWKTKEVTHCHKQISTEASI